MKLLRSLLPSITTFANHAKRILMIKQEKKTISYETTINSFTGRRKTIIKINGKQLDPASKEATEILKDTEEQLRVAGKELDEMDKVFAEMEKKFKNMSKLLDNL